MGRLHVADDGQAAAVPNAVQRAVEHRQPPLARESLGDVRLGVTRQALRRDGRRVCPGAVRRLDAWLDGRGLEDATLAAYLGRVLPRSAASPMKEEPVVTASRRSRSRATAAAPAGLVARTVGAIRRPERPRLTPAALAGAKPWS